VISILERTKTAGGPNKECNRTRFFARHADWNIHACR
jgi:hypothetical protein